MNKKLYRNEYNKVIGGVCSGLAEYFEMDITIVRLLFAFTFFVMGVGFGTYIILWIVLPRKGYPYNIYNNPTVDYTVPPQQPDNRYATPPPPTGNAFGNNYGDNPFASSAPGGNPFGGNPFGGNPVNIVPPKQKSHAGVIIGFVLIVIGAAILVDEYDLIPDFDFETYWPLILVLIGGALIVSGQIKQPWEKKDLHADNNTAAAAGAEEPASTTDSEPTV
jgi:phage shock protein PspC (stress-responsive transcriptional regulator)